MALVERNGVMMTEEEFRARDKFALTFHKVIDGLIGPGTVDDFDWIEVGSSMDIPFSMNRFTDHHEATKALNCAVFAYVAAMKEKDREDA